MYCKGSEWLTNLCKLLLCKFYVLYNKCFMMKKKEWFVLNIKQLVIKCILIHIQGMLIQSIFK